jgi:hypothetical protein
MFIGRKDELKELKDWLESGEPCIAITGKGGIGKTTLVKGFTSTKDFKRSSEAICISLKGETEVVQPIKVVIDGIGKGLKGKIAEWFGERWGEIEDIKIIGFELKKTSKEKIERSLKQILHDLDSKLKGKKIIVVVDDLQLADDKSLRLICELANVNWENLNWILVHRDERKIRESLKDLSGWTPLEIEGMNKDEISELFIEHANVRIEVKGLDKSTFFEVTKGYPNFIDTIVSALKEKYDEIEVTKDFIKENYELFTRPMEFVMDNYLLDEDEKLNLLSIAILKEAARVGSIVNSFRIPINILKDFLKLLGVELKYKKLKDFGFIEIKNEEIDIHDAKRDRTVEVMNDKDKEQVKRVREAAIEFHLGIASKADEEQDHITASSAYLHAYHHASHIDCEKALECLVNASVGFSNCGDDYSAYICSNHALEGISGMVKWDDYLKLLKLGALRVKTMVLCKGLDRYFEFDLDEIVEEVTKTFFTLENAKREKIGERSLEDYIDIVYNIMNYFANVGKADEILDLLKNSPLKEEQKTKLKIHASEALTYLWDERAKELLEEVKDVEGRDKWKISYIRGLWSMDDFEKASQLFEESAKSAELNPLSKHLAVSAYCLAAVLTSDRMRALKMLTNAGENLVRDIRAISEYKFTDAIISVNRKGKVKDFFHELSRMPLGEEQKGRYWMHYSQAFILLDCLDGLRLDEKEKSIVENEPLYKIISPLNDSREALRRLDDIEMQLMYKNILNGIISGREDINGKMAKFIGFRFLMTTS